MGRINPNEMDKYGNEGGNSEWLRLQDDGDIARVQFLYDSYDELDTFACHRINLGVKQNGQPNERWVDCKRDYDDPIDACPFCKAGMPVKPVMILSMYDHADGKIKIWERGKTFRKVMESKFNRYPVLSDMVFEIERHGKKGDNKTTYEVIAMPEVEPVDVSNIERPNFVGSVILDKTPDEMQTYLDTGSFPSDDATSNEQPVRRRSYDEEPVTRRSSRRG